MSRRPVRSILPASRRFRYVILGAVLLAAGAATVAGIAAWRHVRSERLAREGLSAVERRDVPALVRAVEGLHGRDGYESHIALFAGASLLAAGEPAAAVDQLSAVEAVGELRLPALLLMGEACYKAGRQAEAERAFRVAAVEWPDRPEAHRWLAVIYHEMGAPYATLERLRQVARLEPESFFPHRLMGLVQKEDLEDEPAAVVHYRRALELDPPPEQRDAIVRELAEALMHQRDYDGALAALGRGAPDAANLTLRAECLWTAGDRPRAQELLSRVLADSPDFPPALQLAARVAMDEGRPADAVAPLLRVLELDPHDYQARYQLALAYQRTGDAERSKAEMARYEESKSLRDELRELRLKAMRDPADAASRERMAEICLALGKPDLARAWTQAAEMSRGLENSPAPETGS